MKFSASIFSDTVHFLRKWQGKRSPKMRDYCPMTGQKTKQIVIFRISRSHLGIFDPFSDHLLDIPGKSVFRLCNAEVSFSIKQTLSNFLIAFVDFDQRLFFSNIFFRVIRRHPISAAIEQTI
jgi:hypothetical protein